MRRIGPLIAFASSLVFAAAAAHATPQSITSTPQNTTSPFRHNALHEASSQGGMNGAVLAWLDLGAGGGTYDGSTGAIDITLDIYETSALTTLVGTMTGTGMLDFAALSDSAASNVVIGQIMWAIDLSGSSGSALEVFLEDVSGPETDEIWDILTFFADVAYTTSPQGRTPNTIDGPEIILWGSDGTFTGSTLANPASGGGEGGFGSSADLGIDLVLQATSVFVPEPATAWLLGVGLFGLGAFHRLGRRS